MTVRELIEQLSSLDPDSVVYAAELVRHEPYDDEDSLSAHGFRYSYNAKNIVCVPGKQAAIIGCRALVDLMPSSEELVQQQAFFAALSANYAAESTQADRY
jgi:hypothetical protein